MIKLGYYSVNADFDIDSVNYKGLTHLNLSFATVKDLVGTVIFDVKDEEKIHRIRRENPDMMISLSIGGWGAGNFSEAADSDEHRKNFTNTTLAIVEKYDLDGVDLDWEYPSDAESGISAHPDDRENYSLMMKELRIALDARGERVNRKMILTFAMGAVERLIHGMELDKLNEVTDFMNIMTYDMGGSFVTTGHHTSIYPSKITRQKGGAYFVDLMDKNGYPKEKIVYGAAFYGRGADDVRGRDDGIYSRMYGAQGLYFDYDDILEKIQSGKFKHYYDADAIGNYLFDGHTFITYETPETLIEKIKYVRENNLLGIMFWEICTDSTGKLLNTVINEEV